MRLLFATLLLPHLIFCTDPKKLFHAALVGNLLEVQKMIAEGGQVNTKFKGDVLLTIAARNGHLDVVEFLLNSDAAVDARDDLGRTALMYAAQNGKIDVVKVLLKRGAAVDIEDKNKMNALKFADRKEHSDIVKLLEKSANPQNVGPKQSQKQPVINAQAKIQKKEIENIVKRDYPKPWKISEKLVKHGSGAQEPQLTVLKTPKLEKERKSNSKVREHSGLNPLCINKKSGGCTMNAIKSSRLQNRYNQAENQKTVKKCVEDKTLNKMKQKQQRQSEKTDPNYFLKITNFDLLGESKASDDIFRREESAEDSFRLVQADDDTLSREGSADDSFHPESDDDTLSREESDGEFRREYANIDVYRPNKLHQLNPPCFKKAQIMVKKEKQKSISGRPRFKNY